MKPRIQLKLMVLCEVTHEELALDIFYPSLRGKVSFPLGKLIHLNMGIFV